MRLAFTLNQENQKIDFTILGPTEEGRRETLVEIQNKNFYFYEFFASSPGIYTFIINNSKVRVFSLSLLIILEF